MRCPPSSRRQSSIFSQWQVTTQKQSMTDRLFFLRKKSQNSGRYNVCQGSHYATK